MDVRGALLLIWIALAATIGCARDAESPSVHRELSPSVAVDAFGLPLVITLEPPEVPEAIARPSPPLENPSDARKAAK